MSAILPHMVCLSANLECRSEMCFARLAEIQDAKNRHFSTIAQLCRAVSSQLRHVSTIGKKLLNTDTSSTCPHNMVNFGLLTAEIPLASLGHSFQFQRLSCLGSVTARHFNSERPPNFAALNRGHHLYSAGRPSRWALAHILVLLILHDAPVYICQLSGQCKIAIIYFVIF